MEALAYNVSGDGTAIVFIHGFCQNKEVFKAQEQALSGHFKVVSVDLPGHGQSSLSSDLSIKLIAERLQATLKLLKISKAILIGHSMGGYVAMTFAKLYPKAILGVGLINSTPLADSEEKKRDRRLSIELAKRNKTQFIDGFIPNLFANQNSKVAKEQGPSVVKMAEETSTESIAECLKAMSEREDSIDWLSQFDHPFFWLLGKSDKILPVAYQQPYLSLPKHGLIYLDEQSGHMSLKESEALVTFLIQSFGLLAEQFQ